MTKRALQEIADFFGCWVAIDSDEGAFLYNKKPTMFEHDGVWDVPEECAIRLDFILYDYSGDWKDSLTAPSEPPFKEGDPVPTLPQIAKKDPRKAMLDDIRTRIYQEFDSCEHHFVHEAMEFILDEMEAKL